MSLYSAVHILPLHIVQSIVNYVVWTNDGGSDMDKIKLTAKDRIKLLILMKVCRHWRSIIMPLYYYSASISLTGRGIGRANSYLACMLDLDQVLKNESQQHIQRLQFTIECSAIAKPKAATKALRDIVKRCGQLKRARAVIVEHLSVGFIYAYDSSNLEETFVEYARLFNELLPNKRQLVLKSTELSVSYVDGWMRRYVQAPNHFHLFLGTNITVFQAESFPISEELVAGLKKLRLRRLSIDFYNDSSLCIDLIHQHSASLECLKLDRFPHSNIPMLILPPGDSGVLTYPRLKKIDIGWYRGDDFTVCEQFESDPFPALEHFYSKNHLSHGTFAILKMVSPHIRKLELVITREAMDVIEKNNIFTAGSYSALDKICIELYTSYPGFDCKRASRLAAIMLNLSPTARHVGIYDIHTFSFDDAVLPDIMHSDSLRTLNLYCMLLSIHQIVELVSKFKNLNKLVMSLKEYPGGGLEAPDDNELQWRRNELKVRTSNVRTIYIGITDFSNSRQDAEYVVLIASILESVSRVVFSLRRGSSMYNPLKDIQYALKRPVYAMCESVHKVDFCME